MSMKKLLLIDADSIIYYIAYNYRNKKVKKMVELSVNKFISDLLTNSGATDYIGFFGSKDEEAKPNFRYDIYSEYKANRPPTPDFVKKWRPTILKTFQEKWNFLPIEGMEADDAVGIYFTKYKNDYDEIIIATADKDLRQFPCTFYDFKKHEMTPISEFEAVYNLCHQMIMGDSTDHIPGIPGIGKVGAKKRLADCKTIPQLKFAVLRAYYSYDNTLTAKITKDVISKTATSVPDDKLAGLTEKQKERVIRIAAKKAIKEAIDKALPLRWRNYVQQQYQLLRMLTTKPDWFNMPDVFKSPFDLSDTKAAPLTSEEKQKAIASADDFLII